MVARQVGQRSITLGDGTPTGAVRLGPTEYVLGLLDDGAADNAPVTAWLPAAAAAAPPVPLTVARIDSADDATPLAWRVQPESRGPPGA
jgi:hypothetical protein